MGEVIPFPGVELPSTARPASGPSTSSTVLRRTAPRHRWLRTIAVGQVWASWCHVHYRDPEEGDCSSIMWYPSCPSETSHMTRWLCLPDVRTLWQPTVHARMTTRVGQWGTIELSEAGRALLGEWDS